MFSTSVKMSLFTDFKSGPQLETTSSGSTSCCTNTNEGEELHTKECELCTCEMDHDFEAAAVKSYLNMNSEANTMQIFVVSLKCLMGFSFLSLEEIFLMLFYFCSYCKEYKYRTLDRLQMKKGGQLAGMPKLLWLVLFLWWHYAAVGWATGVVWQLNSEAEAQGQSHIRGMQGLSHRDCSGSTTGPIRISQKTESVSGNERNLFLTDKKQETKASPLGNGAQSVQTHRYRPCLCGLLPDQALLPIHLGRHAPSLQCWQGQTSRTWRFVK